MKIRETRLELERVEDLNQVPKIMGDKSLRYKTLYAINPGPDCVYRTPCGSMQFKAPYKIFPTNLSCLKTYGDYYVLKRTRNLNPHQEYTQSELRVMISVFCGLLSERKFQVAEELCHAIKNLDILNTFYSDYGTCKKTEMLCKKLIESRDDIQTVTDTTNLYPKQFQRRRYSIYKLANDLQEAHALICTDPDLTGKFTKISRGLKSKATPLLDTWNPIIGCNLNSTRANLNLLYIGRVSLDIPENTVGVKAGPIELKTLRSICLVKDGRVCNDSFGIKIDSGKIRKRLKAAGVLKEDLLFPDDFAARISTLPVVSKSDFKTIRIFDLAQAEVWYRLSDLAMEYIWRREYKERNKIDVLPVKISEEPIGGEREKFLTSLGIFGDYYSPRKTVDLLEREYIAPELVCNVKNLPVKGTYVSNITKLLNSTGKYNPVVSDFLQTYVIPEIKNGNYKELLAKWEKRKEECRQSIRDLKFRLISGKSLDVVVHGGKRYSILTITETIKIPGLEKYPFVCRWNINDKKILV